MKHVLMLTLDPEGNYIGEAGLPLDNPAGFNVSLKICKVTKKAILVLDEKVNRK